MSSNHTVVFFRTVQISLCLVTLVVFNFTFVLADEVTVTNEQTGAQSTNQSELSVDQQTNIQSSNQTNIVNDIDLNLNTGNNQASQNQSSSDISSGDISATVSLQTQTNQNQVNFPTSSTDSTVQLTNEQTGADSVNQAALAVNAQTFLTLTNQQTITNQITVFADTGHNQANQNGGQVNLATGDIQINLQESTIGNLNQISGNYCGFCFGDVHLTNTKTGSGSTNLTSNTLNQHTVLNQDNYSLVTNHVNIFADTGHNQADDNQGPVTINTGSVTVGVTVETLANLNEVIWQASNPDHTHPGDDVEVGGPSDSGQPDQPTQDSIPTPSTTNTSNNSTSGSSGGSSGGSSPAAIGGQILGSMLPATGSPYTIFIWMIGLFLISMGRFVRLNAGRSPAYVIPA